MDLSFFVLVHSRRITQKGIYSPPMSTQILFVLAMLMSMMMMDMMMRVYRVRVASYRD